MYIAIICVVFLLQEPEQNLLMSIIMDTYSRIFIRMEKDSQDEATKEKLAHVQEHLKKLQENYFPGKNAELKMYAETLWAIKVRQQFHVLWNQSKLDTSSTEHHSYRVINREAQKYVFQHPPMASELKIFTASK